MIEGAPHTSPALIEHVCVHLIKAAFRWAARKGYIARSPVSDDSTLIRSKHAQRARRMTPGEEAALLDAAQTLTRGAGGRLYGLIVAAIETGCRLGELLAWQWADVDLDHRETIAERRMAFTP